MTHHPTALVQSRNSNRFHAIRGWSIGWRRKARPLSMPDFSWARIAATLASPSSPKETRNGLIRGPVEKPTFKYSQHSVRGNKPSCQTHLTYPPTEQTAISASFHREASPRRSWMHFTNPF
ncbi:hypothetical protein FOPG_06964 [Fusarium oxysporum f. sp. conglutinans race 2 54008]|uniref:Uncharacterized protein n=1 Tax=Fusarium oxysporum f. sp. conglutinans race 2 54008 TaxID=1089457 RepID=X0HR97_FUSOX|nr:hypothetical protein FOPG_06964 [Fusarium oxysporum f. sp. conglutinans race 2 54008]